ncbi:hypothetical protein PV733_28085 [Streptomyces europaeiscabiei]|uniref:hypothetical protein n=1 Tax=Streptomyces europaeiscabiei TaxID=146819 RepID=UPI0029B05BAE|nr:hypothetical protein [Streptomyces europaeiscabiei]MDX3712730.1 hypothetical protein [Streptomyces europaeiscabiei]
MSKPNRKRIHLETLRAQRLEAQGSKEIEVELDDEKFVFLRASWWPMGLVKQIRALEKDESADNTDVLALLSSKEQVDRLLELGLTLGDFSDIMEAIQEDAGVKPGESTSSSD